MATADSGVVGVVDKLKRWHTATLRVYCLDGETRDVPVTQRRRRWAAVLSILDSLQWHYLEALDSNGGILGILNNDSGESELDNASLPNERIQDTSALLQLMLKAQDVALHRHEQSMQHILEAQVKLIQTMTDRVVALERSYATNLHLMQQWARQAADATGGQPSGSGLQSDAFMQLLPALLMGAGPGPNPFMRPPQPQPATPPTPKPTNGGNGKPG